MMDNRRRAAGPGEPEGILFELTRIGSVVKVTAVDPRSLVEVSIQGPAAAGEAVLKANAARKLAAILAKRAGTSR
jgi:hypothetical protein